MAKMTRELRKIMNNWDQIDDFKWLKAEPSPHFRLLDSQQLVLSQIWIDIAPGGSKSSAKSILEAVGIAER
jgi:tubulin-specific chaperone C